MLIHFLLLLETGQVLLTLNGLCIIWDFDALQTRELVSEAPEGHITPGLVTQPLSQEQWATLDKVNEALTKEYTVRRQMLLTRCNVTVQSFRWCDKAKVSSIYIYQRVGRLSM